MMDHVGSSTFNRSLVSMAVRSFPSSIPDDGAEEILYKGIRKELAAARTEFSGSQALNYGFLFDDWETQTSQYFLNTPRWKRQSQYFVQNLASGLGKLGVVYPKVQRIKNVSRETAEALKDDGYQIPEGKRLYDLTTLDLEKHYASTGRQVQGRCEMRWSWRFNDLKPRCYYCIGGSMYWKARYIKPITVAFLEAWEMTTVQRRRFPEDISNFLDPDDTVIFWDMTSFTTTLSELKYFLFWIARFLEENPYTRQHPIKLFDSYQGIIEKPIWEILDEYNEAVNIMGEFTIDRVAELIGMDADDLMVVTMMNSGPLGVMGNIGFSTVNHSLASGVCIDRNKGAGLGDDHLSGVDAGDDEGRVLDHMRQIGIIHQEKTGRLPPVKEHEAYPYGKFVKRRMTRTEYGLEIDHLFTMPFLAYVDGKKDPMRTVNLDDEESNHYRFIGQVGALLWDLNTYGHLISAHELVSLQKILHYAYKKVGLHTAGSLPQRIQPNQLRYRLAIPSIRFEDYDPCSEDWAEVLWTQSFGQFISMPVVTNGRVKPPPLDLHDEFEATSNRMTRFLEDLGYIEKTESLMEVIEVDETNRRRFQTLMRGQGDYLARFRVVKTMSNSFEDSFILYNQFRQSPSVVYSTAI